MMRFLFLVALSLVLPSTIHAQDISIRSGEHDGFSRLVLDLPNRVPWSLDQSGNEAVLQLDSDAVSFDTSAVFDRLQRNRIRAVTAGRDRKSISISLNCACDISGFWHGRAMLVIDVKDGVQAVAGKENADADDETQARRSQRKGRDPSRAWPSSPKSMSGSLLREKLDQLGDIPARPDAPRADGQPLRREMLDKSREQLIRELGRAATQGLLSPATGAPRAVPNVSDTESNAADVPKAEPSQIAATAPTRNHAANIHINVQTSIDRDFLASLSDGSQSLLSNACLPASRIDVAAWGTDAPFWEQVGPLRASLSDELDRTDQDIAAKLARVYLYFGFGLEAQQLLDVIATDDPDLPILTALVSIMETGSAPQSALAGQLGCEGPAAVWSALSYDVLPKNTRLDADAVQRGFSALPKHLRSHLGPILSRRFLDAEMQNESALILRVLDRVEETQSAEANLVKAEIALSAGDASSGEAMLDTVVKTNSEPSAVALVQRIDSLIARGEDVSFDVAQLAAAFAHEHADTRIGPALRRAHILALAASGAFDAAFAEVDLMDRSNAEAAVNARADLTARLVTHAGEMDFLRHALAGHAGAANTLQPGTALKLAERLLQAGFLDQAEQALSSSIDGPAARNAKIMRAEIALTRGFPRLAEVELLGLDGRDINILRARARSMVGEHKQAHDLFKSAGLSDEADREAWLATEWAQPSDIRPEDQEVAALESDASDSAGVLSQNRSLLETAGATREGLEAMLLENPAPSSAEN